MLRSTLTRWALASSAQGLHATAVRLHASHGAKAEEHEHDDPENPQPQTQQRNDHGIAETTLPAQESVAMSTEPPKRGRYQARRISGVQQEILSIYRAMLKEAKKLEDLESRARLTKYIRHRFQENKAIPRKMLSQIEWHMHQGRNKLDELKTLRPNSKFSIRC